MRKKKTLTLVWNTRKWHNIDHHHLKKFIDTIYHLNVALLALKTKSLKNLLRKRDGALIFFWDIFSSRQMGEEIDEVGRLWLSSNWVSFCTSNKAWNWIRSILFLFHSRSKVTLLKDFLTQWLTFMVVLVKTSWPCKFFWVLLKSGMCTFAKKNLGKTRNSSFGGLSNSISTFGVTKVTSWAN